MRNENNAEEGQKKASDGHDPVSPWPPELLGQQRRKDTPNNDPFGAIAPKKLKTIAFAYQEDKFDPEWLEHWARA